LLDYSGAARIPTSIARCRWARKSAEDDAQFTRDVVALRLAVMRARTHFVLHLAIS
jgi:hypothetical protein